MKIRGSIRFISTDKLINAGQNDLNEADSPDSTRDGTGRLNKIRCEPQVLFSPSKNISPNTCN